MERTLPALHGQPRARHADERRRGYAHQEGNAFTHGDWNAYASWDPGKYFNFTLGRGKHFIGEGHRSLFLSDEASAYPYLRITTSVWRAKYVNLFTMMNDIRGAQGDPSRFQRKYASMHYLSVNASRRINLALFEAIVWSQGDSLYPRGFDVNYLNPIIFYRPVEFAHGSPDNALLGFSASVKAGHHTLFYAQVMLDEFLLREVRAGDGWYANKQALQAGWSHEMPSRLMASPCAVNGTWCGLSCTRTAIRDRTMRTSASRWLIPTARTSRKR